MWTQCQVIVMNNNSFQASSSFILHTVSYISTSKANKVQKEELLSL